MYIQRVYPNKSPLKILEKRERGHIQGLLNFWGYPLLSQELEMLRISDLPSTFRGSIRIKAHAKFWRKGSLGVSRYCPNFFWYPLLSQELEKLPISIWPVYLEGSSEQNPIKNFGEKGAWTYPGTTQFLGYPLLYQQWLKLRYSNLAQSEQKPIKNFGKSSHSQGLPKIFRASIHMAHHAFIFAIAQLSCFFRRGDSAGFGLGLGLAVQGQ